MISILKNRGWGVALVAVLFTLSAEARRWVPICGVGGNYGGACIAARPSPVVRAVLVHYGSAIKETDLARVTKLLVPRFKLATGGILELSIQAQIVLPLRPYLRRDLQNFASEIGQGGDRSVARLTRLWYYYHSELNLAEEIHEELIKQGHRDSLNASDAILVLSEPQFEGLGFAPGRLAITEQPVEVAWGSQGGGETRFESDERLVDELIHELGHVLGLGHAAERCDEGETSTPGYFERRAACCKASPSGADIMSYCRDRTMVKGDFFYGYTACNRDYLKNVVAPELLQGAQFFASQSSGCK